MTKFNKPLSRIALTGVLVSAVVMSPYSISLSTQSIFAKSKSNELLFASQNNFRNFESEIESSDVALKGVKKSLKDNKIKVVSVDYEEKADLSEYDSIAYNYGVVKKDNKLQRLLQEELENGKKVYLYGGLTVEEYCEMLDIDSISSNMEVHGSKKSKKVTFNDGKKAEKNSSKKESTHDIIGYTLQEDASYSIFISDINITDGKEKIEITDDIYLKEILAHEHKSIEKDEELFKTGFITTNVATARPVKSDYDIIASAWYITKKVGEINSQWKLYQVEDEDDSDYDYFHIEDKSTIEVFDSSFDAEEFYIVHEIPFSNDELDDSEPDDSTGSEKTISIGAPWNISYAYTIEAGSNYDLDIDKSNDIAEWYVDDNELEEDNDDYEFVTSWASSGTYAGIDVSHDVYFYAGIDVETDAGHSFEIRYNY